MKYEFIIAFVVNHGIILSKEVMEEVMSKPNVFMIMPFEDDFFKVFELLKRKIGEEVVITHAGNSGNLQNILEDILTMMNNADVILADLTGKNPNVLYELGVAHALNKKVIVITKDELTALPFDLKSYRAKSYSTEYSQFDELIEYLLKNIQGAVNGNVKFSNPVIDFLENTQSTNSNVLSQYASSSNVQDTPTSTTIIERGFIDYIAEIDQASEELVQIILSITQDMEAMSTGIEDSAGKMQRLKSGGNASATMMRSQTRVAAGYIEGFSSKLRISNRSLQSKWSEIEKSSNDLIESPYAFTPENIESLRNYLASMENLGGTIENANIGIRSMKDSTQALIGIEGFLNQAAKFLINDLSDYLDITSQMQASISRLLAKSKIIIDSK